MWKELNGIGDFWQRFFGIYFVFSLAPSEQLTKVNHLNREEPQLFKQLLSHPPFGGLFVLNVINNRFSCKHFPFFNSSYSLSYSAIFGDLNRQRASSEPPAYLKSSHSVHNHFCNYPSPNTGEHKPLKEVLMEFVKTQLKPRRFSKTQQPKTTQNYCIYFW